MQRSLLVEEAQRNLRLSLDISSSILNYPN